MIGKEVPVDVDAARTKTKAQNIRVLTDYQRAAKDGEKVLYFTSRYFDAQSFKGQQVEMIALAMESSRAAQPVKHYVFSWREGEQPTPEQIEELLDVLEAQTGLNGHQVMAALHQDTDNIHLHVSMNTVSPTTHKVVKPNRGFSREALHRTVATIEHRQGWAREARARYVVLEDGELARSGESKKAMPSTRARDMEQRTGAMSAERIAAEEAADIIGRASTWAELHKHLGDRGIRYERKGSGALLFIGDVPVKASAAGARCSLPRLCKRLGEYEPATAPPLKVRSETQPLRPNMSGWDDYHAARKNYQKDKERHRAEFQARKDAERKALLDRYAERRSELNGRELSGPALNVMRSLMAAERKREDLSLKERHQREQKALREWLPPWPDYEGWLRDWYSPDAAGDYRYHRHEPLWMEGDGDDCPSPRDLRAFVAEVVGDAIEYRRVQRSVDGLSEAVAFTDRGRRIEVQQGHDQDAALAALQLGAAKWRRVTVYGSDDYKLMCSRLAVEHGIEIANPELQETIADAKEARAKARREAQRSPQLAQFEDYARAIQADRYRVTAIKWRVDGSKAAFVLDKRCGQSEGLTPIELAYRMGEMQRLQARGENLYYTPLSAATHHIVIDDMTRARLDQLLSEGFKPAVILESSPGNFQAVLNVSKLRTPEDRDVANRLTVMLNKTYGDPKLSGAVHPHRAPGFENRKPKHAHPDGTFPPVRLIFAEARECSKALAESAVIARELGQQAEALKAQHVSPALLASVARSSNEAYAAHYTDIAARHRGGQMDLSVVDAMIAVRLRVSGHSQEQIAGILEASAPTIRPVPEMRNWTSYAQRTATYAFGAAGTRKAAEIERYHDQFIQLEGREALIHLEQCSPRPE